MGKYSDFKLPKPKLPDFKQQAEKGLERVTRSIQLPDFMGIASEKVNSIKAKIENPDLNEINALIDKLSVSKNVVKVANALGINISEDQINAVLEKKNELESAVAEKSFNAVEKFMSKEGYPIEKPDMNDIASRLSGGEDPLQVGKELVSPFKTMAQDVIDGNKTINLNSITSGLKSKVEERTTQILNREDEHDILGTIDRKTQEATTKMADFHTPEINISFEDTTKKIESLRIDPKIPEGMQKIIDKYKLDGGN